MDVLAHLLPAEHLAGGHKVIRAVEEETVNVVLFDRGTSPALALKHAAGKSGERLGAYLDTGRYRDGSQSSFGGYADTRGGYVAAVEKRLCQSIDGILCALFLATAESGEWV